MENSNKSKKKIIISLICIMLLILFSVGIVYAFFNYTRIGERNNVLNTANLTFSFEDSEWIWLENAFPIADSKGITLETNGTTDILEVDGGIAKFKVIGGHSSGTIHYYVGLVKEDLTELTKSEHERYSIDPSTKIGQLPDGAININLQSSTSNIFESTGLVDNTSELETSGKTFTPPSDTSYVNVTTANSIADLPLNSDNERVLGTGTMSGSVGSRYFELRMWINDSVHINSDLRDACILSTSPSDVTTYGLGYCDPNTEGLPEGIKYVYSTGEYSKLYYSTKIKVQTTDVSSNISRAEVPQITEKITENITPVEDSTISNIFDNDDIDGVLLYGPTKDNAYPIYYYRGDVDNNNIIFGGFCWKIVRTTETGGTKIVYNGVSSGGTCQATGDSTQIASVFNDSMSSFDLTNIGLKYEDRDYDFSYVASTTLDSQSFKFYGKSVSYSNYQYKLSDTYRSSGTTYASDYANTSSSGIRYKHYMCVNYNATNCATVYYYYYLTNSKAFYVDLPLGRTVSDVLNNVSNNDGSMPSIAYSNLVNWYTANIYSYSSYLEDTVFCNDRSFGDLGGWDPESSNTQYLYFGAYNRISSLNPTLSCTNLTDKFTVSSDIGNGQLEYPIGLLTADEYILAGGKTYTNPNKSFYLYNEQDQWTLSPSQFRFNGGYLFYFSSYGYLSSDNLYRNYGLRPVVSLNKDVRIISGTGKTTDPYVVGL